MTFLLRFVTFVLLVCVNSPTFATLYKCIFVKLDDGKTYSLTFLKSSAESAIYVNNSNADGNGKELISYLNEDKSP